MEKEQKKYLFTTLNGENKETNCDWSDNPEYFKKYIDEEVNDVYKWQRLPNKWMCMYEMTKERLLEINKLMAAEHLTEFTKAFVRLDMQPFITTNLYDAVYCRQHGIDVLSYEGQQFLLSERKDYHNKEIKRHEEKDMFREVTGEKVFKSHKIR